MDGPIREEHIQKMLGRNFRYCRLKPRQCGATLLLFTFLTALLLIPLIGLAIDGSVVFWAKAKLSAAVDASALAAARSLSVGETMSEQASSAQSIGLQYLNANFPSGWMGVHTAFTTANIDPEELDDKTRTVTVKASIQVPLDFMRFFGYSNVTVADTGEASRRDLNLILVLDRSNSMNTGGACALMVTAAEDFLTNFAEGRDTVGLVTLQTGANVDFTASQTFKTGITSQLNQLVCNGDTSTAQALYLAYEQLHTINEPGALNVIVLFSDGLPNSVASTWKSNPSNNQTGGLTQRYCQSSSVTGLVASVTTNAYGVYSETTVPINRYNSSYSSGSRCVSDLTFIPPLDGFGNSTSSNATGYTDTVTDTYSCSGRGCPSYCSNNCSDVTANGVTGASVNAAYNAATRIRKDLIDSSKQLKTVIYTIGLGGTNHLDSTGAILLGAVANDPSSKYYDSTQPVGEFVLASDANGLNGAFQKIASQVLRLAE